MMLLSCVNCCHNPLQSDALGTSVGFCTQHKQVLLAPSQLTCGRHFRKDLPAPLATRERAMHATRFMPSAIVRLSEGTKPVNGGYASRAPADVAQLASDPVGIVAIEYGSLNTKIESIHQLRFLNGVRPELAMMSLGRVYVNRCCENDGAWTSGLHLVWWTRWRLLEEPDVAVHNLRIESPAPLARQVELARWSILMMRLLLISDVASYASKNDRVAKLSSLAERAAQETSSLSAKKLLGWIRREGVRLFDAILPESRYRQLAAALREDTDPS